MEVINYARDFPITHLSHIVIIFIHRFWKLSRPSEFSIALPAMVEASGQLVINGDVTRVVPVATLFAGYTKCADEA